MDDMLITPIARIHSDFKEKFGIPRQSGLVKSLSATVVFEPQYRNREALRGIENFSHIWLIWGFSEVKQEKWSPTVRPPRLGGNTRMGVFATRSPFRPNRIGMSLVELEGLVDTPDGVALSVRGADLLDGTPIYDIKPYIPYADCVPNATGGFTDEVPRERLTVKFPDEIAKKIPPEKRDALMGVLMQDPRPSYQDDPNRVYGMKFGEYNIKFKVDGTTLTVTEISE